MRDRMIEVIQDAVGGCDRYWAELIADALIKHGAIMPPNAIASEYKIITVNAEVSFNPPFDAVGLSASRMIERDVRRNIIHQIEDTLGSALILTRRDEHIGGPYFTKSIVRGEINIAVPTEEVSGDD